MTTLHILLIIASSSKSILSVLSSNPPVVSHVIRSDQFPSVLLLSSSNSVPP